VAVDLATVVSRWQQGAGGAQQKYVDGIRNTTKDPIAAAVNASQSMLQNFQASVTSGRWQRAITAVGKAGWQAASEAKAANYGVGIAAGTTAYEQAMQTWLPRINQAASAVQQMPSGTLALNLARANAFATALYNAKRGL
jgi:hypothetical protein